MKKFSLFSTLSRWILAITLAALPLAVLPRLVALQSTYILVKSVLMGWISAAVMITAGLALLFEERAAIRARAWIRLPAAWGLVAFGAIYAASALTGIKPYYSQTIAWMTLGPLGMAVACGWILASPAHARRFAQMMIVGGLGVSIFGIVDAMNILPVFKWLYGKTPEEILLQRGTQFLRSFYGLERGRFLSTLGNPAYVGGFLVVPSLLTMGWLIRGWRGVRPRGWRALAGWAILLCLIVTLVASATREAWVGILFGLAAQGMLALFLRSKEKQSAARISRAVWIAPAALVAALLALGVIFSTPNPLNRQGINVFGRFAQLANPRSDSIHERIIFYTLAGRMFSQHPWLGWGPGMFGVRFYPTIEEFMEEGPTGPWMRITDGLDGRVAENAHNDVFQLGVECGLLGLAAFCWIIASVVASAWGLRGQGENAPAGALSIFYILYCAWIGALATLLTSFPLHTPSRALYFWVLTGTLVFLGLAFRCPENQALAITSAMPGASSCEQKKIAM